MQIYAENRRVYHDYQILETLEAGLVLSGQEVKAIKSGKASLVGAYVKLLHDKPVLLGAKIAPYQSKNAPPDYDSERIRALLMHRREIQRLIGKAQERRLTIVPIKLYNKKDRIKLEIGLAKSRRKYEKREKIREREEKRKMERALKT